MNFALASHLAPIDSTARFIVSMIPRRKRSPAEPVSTLQRGGMARILRPRGCLVECVRGTLWITHDDYPEDVIIDAGDVYLAQRDTRMLVYCMHGIETAEFRVRAATAIQPSLR
jgi:hypothetical protein